MRIPSVRLTVDQALYSYREHIENVQFYQTREVRSLDNIHE